MERNSFIFYDSFYKAISKLKPEEQALCLQALCEYSLKEQSEKSAALWSGLSKFQPLPAVHCFEKYYAGTYFAKSRHPGRNS